MFGYISYNIKELNVHQQKTQNACKVLFLEWRLIKETSSFLEQGYSSDIVFIYFMKLKYVLLVCFCLLVWLFICLVPWSQNI